MKGGKEGEERLEEGGKENGRKGEKEGRSELGGRTEGTKTLNDSFETASIGL